MVLVLCAWFRIRSAFWIYRNRVRIEVHSTILGLVGARLVVAIIPRLVRGLWYNGFDDRD